MTTVPPPPPKVPQGYTGHVEAQPNPPPPPRPPLLAQGVGPAATTGSYDFRPVASSSSNVAPANYSALGPGSPSDWERFGPTPGDFDDSPWFPPRQSPQQPGMQTPPGFSTGVSQSQAPAVSTTSAPQPPMNPTLPAHGVLSQEMHPRRSDSVSPISPSPSQRIHTPPSAGRATPPAGKTAPPVRMDSVDSKGSGVSERAESIDHVIDAWVRPLEPAKPAQSDSGTSTQPDVASPSSQDLPAEPTKPSSSVLNTASTSMAVSSATEEPGAPAALKAEDPYEDLDPWFKSSLTRYVAMLRKEAVADSDEERYKIFTAFTAKETKLREILYNIEHAPPEGAPPPSHAMPEKRTSVSEEPKGPEGPNQSAEPDERKVPIESGLIPVESEELVPHLHVTNNKVNEEDGDGDDANDSGSEYSAGGRPIFRKKTTQPPRRLSHDSSKLTLDGPEQETPLEPLNSNPPRPIYTPFQYKEGPQRGSDDLRFDRPAYQGYSDLRQASNTSGRVMSNALPVPATGPDTLAPPSGLNDKDETFLGLIRHKSNAYQTMSRRSATPLALLPESLKKRGRSGTLVEDLRTLVWTPLDKQTESSWHKTTREDLAKYPDDFAYLKQTYDDWERTASARRHRLEKDRAARQEDSEAHIDELFNEKEIGYADINTLEEQFRQKEARVQLDEERQEVESFMTHVFNPLDEKLKNEIAALRKSYDSALNQLDRDQKGKNPYAEQCSPSVTMKMVNEIHNKLETRFQKRLELALDCEQRRKKAERRPLVFMGDMAGLRKLDGDFDKMEKRNRLEAAKDRDDRANRLMDSFDDAILHGLGMNQSLLDELASTVAKLDATSLRASGLPDAEIEQVLKSATTFAASLRSDSEDIIRCSAAADVALNDADYNVSVAEAHYADSEPDVFTRLEAEKKKEDLILQRDLDSKLESIWKAPKEIESTVQRLLNELRDTPRTEPPSSSLEDDAPPLQNLPPTSRTPPSQLCEGPPLELRPATVAPSQAPGSPPPASHTPDPEAEHKERLRKALEAAKKRNAARTNQ
ncbi:hypothetical protein N7468_002281 [Penicillium chermesinum]|uniref:Uncharacterized protein n=1 Tax=Penicillium chermesinum TaxID=63820 RepID=A0A9W9TY98_9EURO|nr:uncharacterized protein N7468_002281 [Penicillium chermesinum]KAJ5247298.1 hypothetical protein N7468_002281 [Penicillium chermesinum]